MAELLYATRLSVSGPWLLDAEALEALDALLDREQPRLNAREAELVDRETEHDLRRFGADERTPEVREEMRDRYHATNTRHQEGRRQRRLRIYYSGGKSLVSASFAEARKEASVMDEVPTGFALDWAGADISVRLEVGPGDDPLELTVTPQETPLARDLFVLLREWVMTHQPTRWQRWWSSLHGLQWFVWFGLILVTLFFISQSSPNAKHFGRDGFRELMRDGRITSDEIPKAMELILAMQTDMLPPNQGKATMPLWFVVLFFGGPVACVALSIRPYTVLGLGRGRSRVRLWRSWIRILAVVVPGFLFTTFVIPYIQRILGVT